MKNNSVVLANSLAVTTAIVYVACRLLVNLFPKQMFDVAQSWFHEIGLVQLVNWNMSLPSFILGLVSASITVWVIGYLFGNVYNFFTKK